MSCIWVIIPSSRIIVISISIGITSIMPLNVCSVTSVISINIRICKSRSRNKQY